MKTEVKREKVTGPRSRSVSKNPSCFDPTPMFLPAHLITPPYPEPGDRWCRGKSRTFGATQTWLQFPASLITPCGLGKATPLSASVFSPTKWDHTVLFVGSWWGLNKIRPGSAQGKACMQ